MQVLFIKDNTITTAISINQTTDIEVRINPSLYKINFHTMNLQRLLYNAGFGYSIIHKATHIIRELACKRNLLTASIQL